MKYQYELYFVDGRGNYHFPKCGKVDVFNKESFKNMLTWVCISLDAGANVGVVVLCKGGE